MRTYRESARAAAAGGLRESYAQRGGKQQAAHRGSTLVALQRALGNQAVTQLVQMKLRMGQPGDAYEREADNVADRVMRMPAASVQRKCAECEAEEEGRVMRSAPGAAAPVNMSPETESGIQSLRGGGTPMPSSLRSYFEPRFGQDFGRVRLHTDGRAGGLAQSIGARAFTIGGDIAFAPGQYAPESSEGKRLIAHELTHVVQQGQGGSAVQRQTVHSAAIGPMVQRDEDGGAKNGLKADEIDDPNVLVCLILCYLGIPTASWKQMVSIVIRAIWEECQAAYKPEEAEQKYKGYKAELRTFSAIKMIKLVLGFAVEGKIAMIPIIKTAAGKKLQERLVELLLARGATMASLGVASQIARKVVLAVELAFVAGCTAYCGGTALGKKIAETVDSMVAGFAEGMETASEIAGSFGNAIATGLITRPIYTAKATVDPGNWKLSSAMAGRTRADIGVLGAFLWSQMEVEQAEPFLRNVNRSLSSYSIPPEIIRDIAGGMSKAVKDSTGWDVVFTPSLISELSPLTFVQMLKDYKLMDYKKDPAAIAEAAIAAQGK
ncbi:DUF4157 domain-containing protein [Paenibacillus sp. PR3]|uniref:DUF4157 domain-containing protein n=1 Tax=Paenibacillus terricola TaxID=2763503 RepID=A0ABR8N2M8_9BACL|nr:DUF4157 domain-containing protein [Paenibacillus terricola]MBD3922422.1 DUF4157 domain-containing protein [Paenibacillus terricola]